jgi:serine phosphatase RsbU (regulator of sigma subunit)
LIEIFKKVSQSEKNPNKIYDYIIDDIKFFKQGAKFNDDMSMMIL